MTKYEYITSLPLDQFAEWLAKNAFWEYAPWSEWFDNKYCGKCDPEEGTMVDTGKKVQCAWCELHKKCKFFPELEYMLNDKEIIKMWLEVEI